MAEKIAFAAPADEQSLRDIFAGSGMDLAGEIEDHIILRRKEKILGGARLYQAGEDLFHLMVFAVAPGERGRGTGLRLLRELNARPWSYCRDAIKPAGGFFRITTVAKGAVAAFYSKSGYRACDVSQLPAPFNIQCEECPERPECGPVPLVYTHFAGKRLQEGRRR